jgi:hypothetical protein
MPAYSQTSSGWSQADVSYLYTTMSDEGLQANLDSSDFTAPMAGFG